MVRHCYTILLFAASILAVVVCLRPQWGAQWLAQIEAWSQKAQAAWSAEGQAAPPSGTISPEFTSPPVHFPPKPTAGGRPSQWPIQPDSAPSDSDQIVPGESVPFQPVSPPVEEAPSRAVSPQRGNDLYLERHASQDRAPSRNEPLSEEKDFSKAVPFTPPRWWGDGSSAEPSRPITSPPSVSNLREPSSFEGGYSPGAGSPGGISSPGSSRPADGWGFQDRSGGSFHPEGPSAPRDGLSQSDASAEKIPCEGARVVARVASDVVLMSDLWVSAEQFLIALYARQKAQQPDMPAPPPLEGILAQREAFVQAQFSNLLRQLVDAKLAYYDALATVPPEALKNMEDQVAKHFEKVELPKFLDFYGVGTFRELDARLREGGTSVARHRRLYFQRTLAVQWLAQKIKVTDDVGYEEMWAWYQEHASEFEESARVRWEQISVRISKYPSPQAAWATLAQAGNQVLDGRPFSEVARQFSDAPNASQGGLREWTTLGSLRSDILNQALADLPPGALSPILQDGDWLHIVRVLDRQEARRIPFVEAQVKIREEIRKQRHQIQHQAYLDQLRRRVPIWTVLDDRASRSRTASLPRAEY